MANAEASLKSRAAQLGEAAGRAFRAPAWDGVRAVGGRAVAVARRRPWLVGGLAVLLLAGAGYLVVAGGSSTGVPITAVVTKGDVEDTVTAIGSLQPRNYVDVGAQASGQLTKLYVALGAKVTKGQLLADIDPMVQASKVAVDKANVSNLQAQARDKVAQVALAKANYARQKGLMAAGATDKADYDSAEQAYKSAVDESSALTAQITAAQSTLNGDQVTLGYTKIYAPMSGTVVSITALQGQTLNANQTAPIILRIADLSVMTVWTQVSEADVPKLHIGMPAYFTTLGEPDKRWTGTLTQIQPTPDVVNNVVLYTATFDVKNPNNALMTQMTAQVFFVVASAQNVPTIPVSALHGSGATSGTHSAAQGARRHRSGAGNWSDAQRAQFAALRQQTRQAMKTTGAKRYWVQVVGPDGTLEHRPVVIGVSNRVTAQVLSGLKIGDTVVIGMKQNGGTVPAPSASSQHKGHSFGPTL